MKGGWEGIILGEPVSKANSRQATRNAGFIKSPKALAYVESALQQLRYEIQTPREPFDTDVTMVATLYYATRRPDLDESLIMDLLQKGGVIKNDRLIREKHIYWDIDPERPRAEIMITTRNQAVVV